MYSVNPERVIPPSVYDLMTLFEYDKTVTFLCQVNIVSLFLSNEGGLSLSALGCLEVEITYH